VPAGRHPLRPAVRTATNSLLSPPPLAREDGVAPATIGTPFETPRHDPPFPLSPRFSTVPLSPQTGPTPSCEAEGFPRTSLVSSAPASCTVSPLTVTSPFLGRPPSSAFILPKITYGAIPQYTSVLVRDSLWGVSPPLALCPPRLHVAPHRCLLCGETSSLHRRS